MLDPIARYAALAQQASNEARQHRQAGGRERLRLAAAALQACATYEARARVLRGLLH